MIYVDSCCSAFCQNIKGVVLDSLSCKTLIKVTVLIVKQLFTWPEIHMNP